MKTADAFKRLEKKDFAEVLENFLTAGHLVFLRPFRALAIAYPLFVSREDWTPSRFIFEIGVTKTFRVGIAQRYVALRYQP